MALDLTSFDFALKEHYTDAKIANMVYARNPFLSMVAKYEKFGGDVLPLPVVYGNPMGRSATFSTAQANKGNTAGVKFNLTRNKDYSLVSIDNETLDASKGNPNAFMEAAVTEIDGGFQAITRSLATALFRDGNGTIGRVDTPSASTTLTLKTAQDVVNFEVGMKVQFSSAGTSATLRDSGATLTVNAIDRAAGTMTMSANVSSITGITDNDYINVQGDIEAKVKGLEAWLVYSGLSATTFFGVDRTVDATRLAGVPYDGSSAPIEEALIDAAALVGREGGRIDHCFLNFENYAEVEKALGAKAYYDTVKGYGALGFKALQINGPYGPINILADQNCPNNRAFLLQLDTWKLYSLGKAPRILDSDGLKMLRESSSDGVEVRIGQYAQLGCKAPGWNAVVNL